MERRGGSSEGCGGREWNEYSEIPRSPIYN